MRRLSLVFLVLLTVAACAKSPAAPKVAGDPYAIVGAIFTPGLYPDSALVARYVHYSGALHLTDSLHTRYSTVSVVCDELYTGSGFIDDNVITVEWYITVGSDTLAHYAAATLDPLNSPLPGWGADPAHVLRWSLRITGLTPKAPLPTAFVASTTPDSITYLRPIPQATYCAP